MSQETNEYGLHNVAGNVWEWCEDRLAPPGVPLNREPAPNRSTRGESFLSDESCGSRHHFAARNLNGSVGSSSKIGFPVARTGPLRSQA
ncbi:MULTISPECIES: SUMF1/EgtB/PvdO family nonheme iron enzyme [Bradyrhizobium]|jgi:formylglycine-generating enzyme required for sulfatase activity|uniref:SUMF1/EgtB/PvdO family nonheme iron enzyme n=1 Tax=Bradyrhizobium TaxID=374 RepID=UPI000481AA5A|nr:MULTISPECIES: SUMF1/EgtB/PvdO family nonheme iron enzyme [Bradyrhizobium]MCS3447167.1 sulfatase modifying factor 1 [Bradyrhizobium elkanii]MCS3561697.1 sulfatase modifying factor 1 [Bradyrhizobium elkanii]MCW2148463.1 sulfatase modifying factor 1 [Bradyrhizobium elkanii]MCW2352450.1 sulfatase modifying factor 1 [Bradyrhizobium elkanii]MCW2372191.1 sulfatase modifying factor 1 [Bradyrhizobium elkanii]